MSPSGETLKAGPTPASWKESLSIQRDPQIRVHTQAHTWYVTRTVNVDAPSVPLAVAVAVPVAIVSVAVAVPVAAVAIWLLWQRYTDAPMYAFKPL